MNPMQIFWMLWMFILPILGITLSILVPLAWFFIVPKVARMLTWARFKNVAIHAIAEDSGYVELVTTKVRLAEGVEKTSKGWRFLPRPILKAINPAKRKKGEVSNDDLQKAEKVALMKYVLKGLGKPFWLGYAGLAPAVNPAILNALSSNPNSHNPTVYFADIETYIQGLPEQFGTIKKDLTEKLKKLHERFKIQPLNHIDVRAIKEILPELTPPSLMDAIETYSEMIGAKERGKQYTPLILGIGLILGLVIIGIVVIMFMR